MYGLGPVLLQNDWKIFLCKVLRNNFLLLALSLQTPTVMKSIKSIILLSLLVVLVASCTVYKPAIPDIPILTEQGDMQIDAAYSLQGGGNMTLSGALTDHLALQLYADGLGTGGRHDDGYDMNRSSSFRGALGIYQFRNEKAMFALYGGASFGRIHSVYDAVANDSVEHYYQNNYRSFFIQADAGWKPSESFECAARLLIGRLDLEGDDIAYNKLSQDIKSVTPWSESSVVIEPSMLLRVGGPNLKGTLKLGYAWAPDIHRGFFPLNVSLGLTYRLSLKSL